MRYLALVGSLASAAATQTPYLTRLADTFLAAGVAPNYGYQPATLYLGIEKAYELSRDNKYLDWYKAQIDGHVVLEDGSIKGWKNTTYSLDDYRMGNNYLYLLDVTGDEKYRVAADIVRSQLNTHPRNPSGGFWHRKPNFPNQMWLDGIFMADSFYSKWTRLFDADNTTAWDDILLQYELLYSHTLDDESELLVHGWADPTNANDAPWADPKTGRAPHVWGRAVGWYFMSLVETLQTFPTHHRGYKRLLGQFRALSRALKRAQDHGSHGWWQVMDAPYPGSPGNYIEASGSAMFTFGLLKGIELGYISGAEYLRPASNAYKGLVTNFISVADNGTVSYTGTVAECGLSTANATYEYYVSVRRTANDFKGSGPFMLAAYEWERWAKRLRVQV